MDMWFYVVFCMSGFVFCVVLKKVEGGSEDNGNQPLFCWDSGGKKIKNLSILLGGENLLHVLEITQSTQSKLHYVMATCASHRSTHPPCLLTACAPKHR